MAVTDNQQVDDEVEDSDDEDGVCGCVPAEEGCNREEWAEDWGMVLGNVLCFMDAVEKKDSKHTGGDRGNGEPLYGLF